MLCRYPTTKHTLRVHGVGVVECGALGTREGQGGSTADMCMIRSGLVFRGERQRPRGSELARTGACTRQPCAYRCGNSQVKGTVAVLVDRVDELGDIHVRGQLREAFRGSI